MGGVKKEYCLLPGTDRTVLAHSVSAFTAFPCINRILIIVPADAETGEAVARRALPLELLADTRIDFTVGCRSRRASVHNGLKALRDYNPDYVLIHDACRPFVSARLIQAILDSVQQHQAIIPLLPLIDTPKEISQSLESNSEPVIVMRHVPRHLMGIAQTPQAFDFAGILGAHEKALQRSVERTVVRLDPRENSACYEYTDDAEVWGEFCSPVMAIPGEEENRKITFPHDLRL